MKYIGIFSAIIVTLSTLQADTPTPASDSFAYKVMRTENFIHSHHHFFNIIGHSIKIGAAAFTLKNLYAFHNDMFNYMKDEHDNFGNIYTEESQKIKPNWLYPWVSKSCKKSTTTEQGTNEGIHGDRVTIAFPSPETFAISAYLFCSGSYGIYKEIRALINEYITSVPKLPQQEKLVQETAETNQSLPIEVPAEQAIQPEENKE